MPNPDPNRNPYPYPYDEGMELPASAQDGPSSDREIVEPQFGGRWDEALELERRAFRIRNHLPPGGQISFIPNSQLKYFLYSDDRHFTLCCIENGTSIVPIFEALQASERMPLNAAAAVARGNKRKAVGVPEWVIGLRQVCR